MNFKHFVFIISIAIVLSQVACNKQTFAPIPPAPDNSASGIADNPTTTTQAPTVPVTTTTTTTPVTTTTLPIPVPVPSPTTTLAPPPPPPPPPPINSKLETFKLYNDQKMDILVVVDNSESMQADQGKLGPKFSSFISSLAGKDWQIGITTTDLSGGVYSTNGQLLTLRGTSSKILTPSMSSGATIFRDTIIRRETLLCAPCGDGNEQALGAIVSAFNQKNTANAGFFREGADLAVVILSDEDEQSTRPNGSVTPEQVVSSFKANFGLEKRLQVSSFVILPNDTACLAQENAETPDGVSASYGTAATELSMLTEGFANSICLPDFGPELAKISGKLLSLMTEIELAEYPKPDSVEVELEPADQSVKFTVVGKKVVFSKAPSGQTIVKVSYTPL